MGTRVLWPLGPPGHEVLGGACPAAMGGRPDLAEAGRGLKPTSGLWGRLTVLTHSFNKHPWAPTLGLPRAVDPAARGGAEVQKLLSRSARLWLWVAGPAGSCPRQAPAGRWVGAWGEESLSADGTAMLCGLRSPAGPCGRGGGGHPVGSTQVQGWAEQGLRAGGCQGPGRDHVGVLESGHRARAELL